MNRQIGVEKSMGSPAISYLQLQITTQVIKLVI